mgnify:CR=1 FL=1
MSEDTDMISVVANTALTWQKTADLRWNLGNPRYLPDRPYPRLG